MGTDGGGKPRLGGESRAGGNSKVLLWWILPWRSWSNVQTSLWARASIWYPPPVTTAVQPSRLESGAHPEIPQFYPPPFLFAPISFNNSDRVRVLEWNESDTNENLSIKNFEKNFFWQASVKEKRSTLRFVGWARCKIHIYKWITRENGFRELENGFEHHLRKGGTTRVEFDSGWWLGGIQYNRAIKFTYNLYPSLFESGASPPAYSFLTRPEKRPFIRARGSAAKYYTVHDFPPPTTPSTTLL